MGDVDFRPDLCSEGGGLIDDFDGRIADARFVSTNYNDRLPSPVTVASIKYDIDGTEYEDLPAIGGFGGEVEFLPDDSGHGLNKLKSKAKLTKTCNFVRLLDSLIVAGFPVPKMESRDISCIIGLEGHFLREVLDTKGMKKDPNEREKTVLLCTKITKLPWEGGKTGAKGRTTGKVKPIDAELAETVAGIIKTTIIGNGGEMPKKDMMSAIFTDNELTALENKRAALKLAGDDSYLKGRDEWAYEDGVLKMG